MFLLNLLRSLFGRKKRDMAHKKKPYSLTYSDHQFKFMMPRYKKFAYMLTDKAIEERTHVCRFYNQTTIKSLLKMDLNVKDPEPVYPN